MYLNVLSFKNGRVLTIQSEVPVSVDQLSNDWNVVTDEVNKQILSFRGSEVVSIASAKTEDPALTTKITKE